MGFKKGSVLLAAAAFALSLFAGCAAKEPPVEIDQGKLLVNLGQPAKLTVAYLEGGSAQERPLREIAEKYAADFPETEIEFLGLASKEELYQALRGGEADLAQVESEDQAELVRTGALLDFYPYMLSWREASTMTSAAKRAVSAMGIEHAYLIPFDFDQDLLYYRSDWFQEAGLGLDAGMARCRTWQEIGGGEINGEYLPGAGETMGDRGKLAFAGKDRLTEYFNSMIWGAVGRSCMVDPAAGYFSAVEGHSTIFTIDKTALGVAQFRRVMENAALEGTESWTQDEALAAFLEGKAGMLLAGRDAAPAIRDALSENQWSVMGFPRGLSGSAVFTGRYTGWGVSAATKEQDVAVHFLTYLSSADCNTHFAKECGTMPIHLEAVRMEESLLSTDLATELDMAQHSNWYQYASEPVMLEAHTDWQAQLDEKLRQLLSGELSDSELLSFMKDYWTEALAAEGPLWE